MTLVLIAAIAAISAVRRFDFYGFQSDSKIGWISKMEGTVQVKSGDLDFRPVATGATLSDGDQIVTGPSSLASINFHSGRTADCLANSRITVSSLEDAVSSPTILIDATRSGQTEVALANSDSRPVILLTGNGAITVSAGESVIAKSTGAAGVSEVVKKDIKTGKTTILTKLEAVETTKIIQQALAAVATPTPTPIPTLKPQPKINATASLVSPKAGTTLWTVASLSSLSTTQMDIVVNLKSNLTPTSVSLELRPPTNGKATLVALAATGQPNTYAGKIAIGKLIDTSKSTNLSGAAVHAFDASLLLGDGSSAKRIAGVGAVLIGSLNPLGQSASAAIGLKDLQERPVSGPWLAGKTADDPNKFPLVITTVKAGVIKPILAILRSAPSSGFSAPAAIGPAGTFVVKDQEVIAQISGAGLNNSASDRVRELLEGDFVFTGPADALVSAKKYSINEIQALVAASVQSGKSIFVFQDQSLFQVNAEFVRKHPSVASFVRRNSSAFFTRQVKINSFR